MPRIVSLDNTCKATSHGIRFNTWVLGLLPLAVWTGCERGVCICGTTLALAQRMHTYSSSKLSSRVVFEEACDILLVSVCSPIRKAFWYHNAPLKHQQEAKAETEENVAKFRLHSLHCLCWTTNIAECVTGRFTIHKSNSTICCKLMAYHKDCKMAILCKHGNRWCELRALDSILKWGEISRGSTSSQIQST